jgi:OmpA family protein
MLNRTALFTAAAALLLSTSLSAQQPAAASSLSSSLGLYVFPAKNQNAQQQSNDETGCFGWAKTQTNIDPMAIKPQVASAPPPPTTDPASGQVVRGAARGAVAGTAIGAVAGDTGKGAAIGATAGVLAGAGNRQRAKQQAAADQQQAAAQQQQQAQDSIAQQKATYNRAFGACMEGKGYTVK